MTLTATIPAAIQDFIPVVERTPKAFAEAWRYTPMAGVALVPAAPQQTTHSISADTILQLDTTGAANTTINVAAGVTLTLIENVQPGQTLAQCTLLLGAGAVVNHIRQTHSAADDVALLQTQAALAEKAEYHFYALTTGAKRMRQRVQVDLQGSGASATIACAYLLAGAAHHDLTVALNHLAPNTTSRQHVKGVVRDTARGAFQGKIHVAKDAQDIEAYQLHKALLLGARAEVDAKPELEIYADRVKCSHGNAIGALDDAALFYLKARGIDDANARRLLTQAFLADTLDYAPASQRDMLAAKLMGLLGVDNE